MNTRYRMLIWEQSRTAGVLCAFIGGIVLLLYLALWLRVPPFNMMHAVDTDALFSLTFLGAMIVTGLVLIVRQDAQAHLAVDFESRLLRLPVRTTPITFIVLGMRFAFLCALVLFLYLANLLLCGKPPESAYLVLGLHIFFWGQALSWGRRSIPGLGYLIPGLFLCIFVAFRIQYPAVRLLTALENMLRLSSRPVSLLHTLPVTLGLAWLGVVWQRRDEQHGPPAVSDLYDRLRDIQDLWAGRASTRFATPFDAQLWFEQRRVGSLLPVLTLLCTGGVAGLFWAIPESLSAPFVSFWFAPHLGLFVAALIAGPISLRPRGLLAMPRPQTPRAVGVALLLIQARALFICFLLVLVLSAMFMLLHGEEGVIVVSMLLEGHLDWLGVSMLLVRPALTAVVIAWILLWLTTAPLFTPPVVAILAYVALIYRGLTFRLTSLHEIGVSISIIILLVAALTLLFAWRRGLLSARQSLTTLFIWQNLALLILLLSPYVGPHFAGAVLCATVAALIMLPLAAVPLSLMRRMASR